MGTTFSIIRCAVTVLFSFGGTNFNECITAGGADVGSPTNSPVSPSPITPSPFTLAPVNCNADTIDPIAICKDITVDVSDFSSVDIDELEIDNGSYDTCDDTLTYSSNTCCVSCSDAGKVVDVELEVKDDADNKATCTSKVTVNDVGCCNNDNTNPIAVCNDVTVQVSDLSSAGLDEEEIGDGSSDICGPITLSLDTCCVYCSDVGKIIDVELQVKDGNDNTDTCTAKVTVENAGCTL